VAFVPLHKYEQHERQTSENQSGLQSCRAFLRFHVDTFVAESLSGANKMNVEAFII